LNLLWRIETVGDLATLALPAVVEHAAVRSFA